MPAVETNMIPLGFVAPAFSLPEAGTGKICSLDELKGDTATLVIFMCNHCPYVVHVLDEIVKIGWDYKDMGIRLIGISSNDIERYPDDSPEKMKELAEQKNFSFPYLYDETQEVAKAYFAACTPDFSIFDKDMKCVYRGQLDNARPGNKNPVTGKDIREALDAILAGRKVEENQIPSIGCSIKWK